MKKEERRKVVSRTRQGFGELKIENGIKIFAIMTETERNFC